MPGTVNIPAKQFTTKQMLLAAFIFLLFIGVIAFIFYQKGKKTTTIAQVPTDNVPGDPGNSAGVSDSDITKIAGDLHTEMDGFNWERDTAPYHALMLLGNADFVRVYNAFNTKFQAASGATLKGWIDGEKSIWDTDFDAVKKDILSRMESLNLK
ncbi:MAG: hypothetical protein ACXVPW_18240 [Bacteroidia bacterium]